MKCAVCNRILAPTLSICPACGTMIGDTVREELQANISALPKPVNVEKPAPSIGSGGLAATAAAMAPSAVPVRRITADLSVKTTNPTLVGFQSKRATLPDWRLQLQNSVRQRTGGARAEGTVLETAQPVYQTQTAIRGATALKAEYAPETASAVHPNEKLAAALDRIEKSRRKFSVAEEAPVPTPAPAVATPNKNYPFDVVSRIPEPATRPASVNVLPKPKLVSSLRVGKEIFDTNKLPPLPIPAKVSTSFEKPFSSPPKEDSGPLSSEVIHIPSVEAPEAEIIEIIKAEEPVIEEAIVETDEAGPSEIEDLAPFAVRFNSGLFDLIIGGFSSLILLSPFMLMGGSWFTWAGISAFLATFAVVMFIYLTTCLGLFGKTFGMRIFSLELVDVDESDYPTFHQAALNSTIYLISLAFGGIGFLTVPFNEEKRAVHDLLSGTIVVKEF